MADPKGFMTTPREVASRRPVAERVHDWHEVYPESPGKAVLPIITAQAGQEFVAFQTAGDAAGCGLEHQIPGVVAVIVIDRLETVQIDEEDGDLPF